MFGDGEVVEPFVVFGNDNGEIVVDVIDDFAAVLAIKIADDDLIIISLPDNKVIQPVDGRNICVRLEGEILIVHDVVAIILIAAGEGDDALKRVGRNGLWLEVEHASVNRF